MSEYPYEGKIHSDDKVNYSTVYSSDGIRVGKVEVAFAESFIVKFEMEYKEIKYEIPRLEIASLIDKSITQTKEKRLRSKISNIFNRQNLENFF